MTLKRLNLEKWTIKEVKMTYILVGKFNGECIITVDRVVNFNPSEDGVEKIYHPKSNHSLHLSLTGDGLLMDIIKEYDDVLLLEGETLILNQPTIKYLGTELENRIRDLYPEHELEHFNSLYAIDDNAVYRYDLEFINNIYTQYNTTQINEGEYSVCANAEINYFDKDIDGIKELGLKDFSQMRLVIAYKNQNSTINAQYKPNQYFHEGFDTFIV